MLSLDGCPVCVNVCEGASDGPGEKGRLDVP